MTAVSPPQAHLATHEVTNQPPALADVNVYLTDAALRGAVQQVAGEWLDTRLADLGAVCGAAETLEAGDAANRHPPELATFDRFGHRLDEVRFHPAYHRLMALAMEHRIHDIAWSGTRTRPYTPQEAGPTLQPGTVTPAGTAPQAGAPALTGTPAPTGPAPHAGHAAALAVFTQAEAGVMCPINMTYAALPVLRAHPAGADWAAKLVGGRYDPGLRPMADKDGVTFGMAMTEKQGGSDVRANATQAAPVADGLYRLTGHKWFCSAPMSDAFLTLAQAPGGLTCFLVPRVLPDGARNAIHLMRLKDKLGNRSNASAEIEYHGALASPMGAQGDGVRTIIEMVHHTRLGTVSATLGIMRAALAQALHHAAHRRVFQRRLADQPAMRAVLAELQVEYEAAAALVLHVAAQFDAPDTETRAYARLTVALAKYLLAKRCPTFVAECLEVLGGAGYVEDGPMPRLYREAPLNGIWEGSGNVIALDILRTLDRTPSAMDGLRATLADADPALAGRVTALGSGAPPGPAEARHVTETLALALQSALLVRMAPDCISDAFGAIVRGGARSHGATVSPRIDTAAILARAGPEG